MNRYTIGGVAFSTDETLLGLETDGFADAELVAHFTGSDLRNRGATGRQVAGPGGLSGVVDVESMGCWILEAQGHPSDRAWRLRQMAPVFSSALDRLVLHASAVETQGGIVGFVGESGVGKSTLARFLAQEGHRIACDDLMPVRFRPLPCTPIGHELRPISALFFLERSPTNEVSVAPLEAVDTLRLLIENGFGEHGDSETWSLQFDAYHRLVESIPLSALVVPNDLAALPAVSEVIS